MSPKDGRARGASRELQTTRIYLYLHKHIADSTISRADKMKVSHGAEKESCVTCKEQHILVMLKKMEKKRMALTLTLLWVDYQSFRQKIQKSWT